jgi:hypothetical protein
MASGLHRRTIEHWMASSPGQGAVGSPARALSPPLPTRARRALRPSCTPTLRLARGQLTTSGVVDK